jgi:hypothetical protein
MNKPLTKRLVVLVRSDQKAWLQERVAPLRSLGDVVRDLIDSAITSENQHK